MMRMFGGEWHEPAGWRAQVAATVYSIAHGREVIEEIIKTELV